MVHNDVGREGRSDGALPRTPERPRGRGHHRNILGAHVDGALCLHDGGGQQRMGIPVRDRRVEVDGDSTSGPGRGIRQLHFVRVGKRDDVVDLAVHQPAEGRAIAARIDDGSTGAESVDIAKVDGVLVAVYVG